MSTKQPSARRLLPCLSSLLLASCALAQSDGGGKDLPPRHPDLPEEFKQLIPRGRIASVDQPQMIPGKDAELPGDAWVLGVLLDGKARAYSLNLLNRHEIVNDRVGERSFAAVW